MPSQRYPTPSVTLFDFPLHSGGAPQPTYPPMNQGSGQLGFTQLSDISLPHRIGFDAGSAPFGPSSSPVFPPDDQQMAPPFTFHDPPGKSCCSPKQPIKQQITSQHGNHESHDVMSQMMKNEPRTMFEISANHATYEHPIKADPQTVAGQSDPGYIQVVATHAPSGVMGQAAPPADTNEITDIVGPTTHQCNCTDCQCMACPVHPGNATTKARVAEMHELLEAESSQTPMLETNPSWPSDQVPNEPLTFGPHQLYPLATPSNEQEFGNLVPQSDYGPQQAALQWGPPALDPQTPESSHLLGPGFYDHATNPGVSNGDIRSLSLTPTQNYLCFNFPLDEY